MARTRWKLSELKGDLLPSITEYYSLGSTTKKWLAAFVVTVFASALVITGGVTIEGMLNVTNKTRFLDSVNFTKDICLNATCVDDWSDVSTPSGLDSAYDVGENIIDVDTDDVVFNLTSTQDFIVQDNGSNSFVIRDDGSINISNDNVYIGATANPRGQLLLGISAGPDPRVTSSLDDNTGIWFGATDQMYLQAGGRTYKFTTTQLRHPWGGVTAAQYTWNDDTNTGMSLYGSDILGFTVGGHIMFTLDETNDKIIFNENSYDFDFRIETDTEENMVYIDGAGNNMSIAGGYGSTGVTIYDDGDISTNGNIHSDGNITAQNVFLPAYVSSHTNNTLPVLSSGVWVNVTFDHEADEFKKRITHSATDGTNTTFIIQDEGIYEITYTMSFEDSAQVPTSHVVTRVTNNDVELNGFTIEEDLGIQNQDASLHHSDLVGLTTDDEIKLSFTSDDTTVSLTTHLTYGIHKNTGHLTIKRIA